jgi:RNA polymerase sigma-70 factor (ECF subfamily)
MAELPDTRLSLLVRIRDLQDQHAWSQFVDVYGPVVYGFARRRGFQEADASDLTQEVMRAVAAVASRLAYDPRKGSFRGWLYTVARNKMHDFLAARGRQCPGSGDTGVQAALEELAAPQEESLWEEEYQRQLLHWAADRVRGSFEDSTWQAFWQLAVEGKSGKEAALALGLTLAATYMAKSRVLARLKEEIHQQLGDDAGL